MSSAKGAAGLASGDRGGLHAVGVQHVTRKRGDETKDPVLDSRGAEAELVSDDPGSAARRMVNVEQGEEIMVAKSKQSYVIVRTYSAGVFAGNLKSRDGKEVVLEDARRLWYWDGAASLSQLAVTGTLKPDKCKFPVAVPSVTLTEAIEILDVTPEAEKSIKAVPVWQS